MKKRRLFSLLLAAAMSLALVSCGNGGDTSGNGTADGGNASQVDADGDGYKDTVKLAISTDPNLDPWLTGMAYDLNVGRQIYDPLFREGENGEVEPWLAEGYEMVDDTHIKLTLRKGVKFHDGNELTTKDETYFAYTEAEKQQHLEAAILTLDETLPGENSSLDEVRQDLAFPETLEDGDVQVCWTTVPYGVIDESGRLLGSEDVDGVLVEIQGTLTCGGKEALYTVYAKVFPQEMPKEEQLHQSILNELSREDSEHGSKAILELPAEVDGRKLYWLYARENPVSKVLGLTLLTALVIWIGMDQQVHRQAKERQTQLLLDYPDLMWKLAMLLGAGMSMKGAFWRLSGQYQREKKEIHYVYEELTCACYEMQSGIAEADAYERFGRRCQMPEYIRLGTVLSQNLRKGTKGLNTMLEQEAAASFTERKNNARKLGEKAGTKLLFPMLLMLGIVLVILMVPAFLSF